MSERRALGRALEEARELTLELVSDLGELESRRQPDALFSPVGWHFGHIAWQEEQWVLQKLAGHPPLAPELDCVLDSFRSEKSQRPRDVPPLSELRDYAARVRQGTLLALERVTFDADDALLRDGHVFRFLANHERQHAELIATVRWLAELFLDRGAWRKPRRRHGAQVDEWVHIPAASVVLGDDSDPDGWDNERKAHRVDLAAFELRRYPVTNAEWLAFVDAGGYSDESFWDDAGSAWRDAGAVVAPLGWRRAGREWVERTLAGERPLEQAAPVCHVSFHEAQAYARFAGARLPTEAEWELAASVDPATGRKRRFAWGDGSADAELALVTPAPAPIGSFPAARAASGVDGLCGGVWEWTSSVFLPYAGFEPQPYAGYSEPWFDGAHRVARGGCFATAAACARSAFRNWYRPELRQPALGLRLSRSP